MRPQVKHYAALFVKGRIDRIPHWTRVIKTSNLKELPRINSDWSIITELMLVAKEVLDEAPS